MLRAYGLIGGSARIKLLRLPEKGILVEALLFEKVCHLFGKVAIAFGIAVNLVGFHVFIAEYFCPCAL